jgi:flagellar L-ring protein precursor FlgH
MGRTILLLVAAAASAWTARADAQSGSLYGNPDQRRPLTIANSSWTYVPPQEPKVWKLNDLLTVMVEEKAKMTSEGQVDQRKKIENSMALTDWVQFDGWSLIPATQSAGDPTIGGIVDNKYRAQANLQNRDLFQAEIKCAVVDVRPNGSLVVEGRSHVQVNEEEWELYLSGVIQPDDILPNKTIKSQDIAEKRILRRSVGQGRDGIRRGFIGKFLDKVQPF